jgi:hypothetical protein
MSSSTYIPYYKKRIGELTELVYHATKHEKPDQKKRYQKELDVMTSGLNNLERQKAIT